MNQIVCDQNYQLHEKTEMLDIANKNIKLLKETMEMKTVEVNNYINKIRKEKCNLQKDNEELKTNITVHIERLKCLEFQNEQYVIQINELQNKLCITVRNGNEMQNLSTENMEKTCDGIEKLQTKIISQFKLLQNLKNVYWMLQDRILFYFKIC